MKQILILGAGLSASSLIRYLLKHAEANDWTVKVVDRDLDLATQKIGGHPRGEVLSFDALDSAQRCIYFSHSDLIISMLPARFHVEVARDCIATGKPLITPSYISKEMRELDQEAREKGVLIMNEIGVDPGIDHMSAMRVIDEVKARGGKLTAFRSYCGGLIAPVSDNNPVHYKFTWNPRNVVLAGQGSAACFLDHHEYKYLPYHQLFKRLRTIEVEGYGDFVAYANRDSLSYRTVYGLEDIPSIMRGTLRRPEFCDVWQVFVDLGMTEDGYQMEGSEKLSPRSFLNAFLPYREAIPVEQKFIDFLGEDRKNLYPIFEWLGFFENKTVSGIQHTSPAELLQLLLEEKLSLQKGDKDMLVMLHEFEYVIDDKSYIRTSHMVDIGEDERYTSMSNTVGLPVAICAKMVLNGDLNESGVHLPINKEVYEPILNELESLGIKFTEKEVEQ